jgi:hypothetical protein
MNIELRERHLDSFNRDSFRDPDIDGILYLVREIIGFCPDIDHNHPYVNLCYRVLNKYKIVWRRETILLQHSSGLWTGI